MKKCRQRKRGLVCLSDQLSNQPFWGFNSDILVIHDRLHIPSAENKPGSENKQKSISQKYSFMLCDYQLNSVFCLVYQSVGLFSSYPHNQSVELRHNIHPLTFNYPGLSHGGSRVFQRSLFPLPGDAKAFPKPDGKYSPSVLGSGSTIAFFPVGIAWKTTKEILSRCPNHLSWFLSVQKSSCSTTSSTQMTNLLILSVSLLLELISVV